MTENGKIYIVITNRTPQEVDQGTAGVAQTEKVEEQTGLSKYAEHQFMHFATAQAKQAISYTISNIGNFTGDYEEQRHISALVELGGKLMSIGATAITGAKVGGAYGAIIGAVVATTSIVITDVRAEYLKAYADAKKNLMIKQLRERSGMYSLMDGNRGTEN